MNIFKREKRVEVPQRTSEPQVISWMRNKQLGDGYVHLLNPYVTPPQKRFAPAREEIIEWIGPNHCAVFEVSPRSPYVRRASLEMWETQEGGHTTRRPYSVAEFPLGVRYQKDELPSGDTLFTIYQEDL